LVELKIKLLTANLNQRPRTVATADYLAVGDPHPIRGIVRVRLDVVHTKSYKPFLILAYVIIQPKVDIVALVSHVGGNPLVIDKWFDRYLRTF
jgi:hypothetical protein